MRGLAYWPSLVGWGHQVVVVVVVVAAAAVVLALATGVARAEVGVVAAEVDAGDGAAVAAGVGVGVAGVVGAAVGVAGVGFDVPAGTPGNLPDAGVDLAVGAEGRDFAARTAVVVGIGGDRVDFAGR